MGFALVAVALAAVGSTVLAVRTHLARAALLRRYGGIVDIDKEISDRRAALEAHVEQQLGEIQRVLNVNFMDPSTTTTSPHRSSCSIDRGSCSSV
jgi:cell division protein FtsX